MPKKMHFLCWAGFVMLIIGGLNWGLVGLFDFNLISAIFGRTPILERVAYVAIGLSAVGIIIEVIGICPLCKPQEELTCKSSQPQPQI